MNYMIHQYASMKYENIWPADWRHILSKSSPDLVLGFLPPALGALDSRSGRSSLVAKVTLDGGPPIPQSGHLSMGEVGQPGGDWRAMRSLGPFIWQP